MPAAPRELAGSLAHTILLSRYLAACDIKGKEFYAIIHTIRCWGESFRTKHIIFHTDRTNIFDAIRDLSIRSSPVMELL